MQIGAEGEIFELTVDEGAPIDGLSLIDAAADGLLPDETVIVAIVRDDELHIPRGESDVQAGDTVTIFAKGGASDRTTDAFTRG